MPNTQLTGLQTAIETTTRTSENSPSAGWREVEQGMVDPTPERPETTIARMSKARISAYVTEVTA